MALPPQFKVSDPVEFISKNDSSFDSERWEKEMEEMKEKGENSEDHPVFRYYTGKTRFSLSAEGIKDYFDDSKKPIVFQIKRLNRRQFTQIKDLLGQGSQSSAHELAFQFGVKDIRGEDSLRLEGPQTKTKFLTDSDLDRIEIAFGRSIFSEVGQACVIASGDLSPEESKV